MTRLKVFSLFLAVFSAIPALQGMDNATTTTESLRKSAGILPYTVDSNGEVLFLLGYFTSQKRGKQYWTLFDDEVDEEEGKDLFAKAAVRGTSIDLRGAFGFLKTADTRSTHIKNCRKYLKSRLCETDMIENERYRMYLVHVDYVDVTEICRLPRGEDCTIEGYCWQESYNFINSIPSLPKDDKCSRLHSGRYINHEVDSLLIHGKEKLKSIRGEALKKPRQQMITGWCHAPQPPTHGNLISRFSLWHVGVCAVAVAAVYGLYAWYNKTEDTDEDDAEAEVATEAVTK